MLVLLNALQAGNRSGTGRYAAELAHRLPGFAPDLEFVVAWPRGLPHPLLAKGTHEAFLLQDARLLHRLYFDQFGIRAECHRLMANVVHYPANVGPLTRVHNTVITVHDLTFFREPSWYGRERALYYRFAVRRSVRLAKRIVTDSQATAHDLEHILGVPRDIVDVIPLGVDDQFRPMPPGRQAEVLARYRLPERFFLYVGTLEPRKNLVRLIHAWNIIAPECDCDLVLAGRDGWEVAAIRRAAAESPHRTRIHFPGFIAQEDMPSLISAAHVFVWPSLWEGFGLPPLDAMACGTPTITSNLSSLPEVAGDAAVLVDPLDEGVLADAMLDVATNATLRKTLIEAGRARAARFTWARTAERTVESYRAALS